MSNYYDLLGINKNSSQEEIKKAYRKKALEHHPDKGGDADRFREISEAYEVLSDPSKKDMYDRYGRVDNNAYQTHGFDMNDIFSQFDNFFGGGRNNIKKGSDIRINLNLSLDDIIFGCNKNIKFNRKTKCNDCNGTGGAGVTDCQDCKGTGQRFIVQRTPFGEIRQSISCNTCGASGKKIKDPCKTCNAEGVSAKEEVITIDIPCGVHSGMNLTMPGKGHEIMNGIAGDLYIGINEIPHSKFTRDGNNLRLEQLITISDAVLGTKIKIDTPYGVENIDVSSGTSSGTSIYILKKGVPIYGSKGVGDLIITLKVIIPVNLTNEQREIFEKLKQNEIRN